MKKNLLTTLQLLCLLLATTPFCAAQITATNYVIGDEVNLTTAKITEPLIYNNEYVEAARFVNLNYQAAAKNIELELFADYNFYGTLRATERHPTGAVSYWYDLQNTEFGYAIITATDGIYYAKIQGDNHNFTISYEGKAGVYAIAQLGLLKLEDEGNCTALLPAALEQNKRETDSNPTAKMASVCEEATSCSAAEVNVLIMYTDDARVDAGGTAAIQSFLATVISEMNMAFDNSQVDHTMRLAHAAEVDYEEQDDSSVELSRLRNPNDGFMDEAHVLRNQYQADLVSLVACDLGPSCGRGYLNTNPDSYSSNSGFNVNDIHCIGGNMTLAHELGHNMGLNHDWDASTSEAPCSHSHGYVNQAAFGGNTDQRWRTIMAYNQQCSDAGFSCQRLPYFSNPDLDYGPDNDPMGREIGVSQPADNAHLLNRSICQVADFRTDEVKPDLIIGTNNLVVNGSTITMTLQIKNIGNAAAPVSTLSYYASTNNIISTGDTKFSDNSVAAIPVGQAVDKTLTIDLSTVLSEGSYYLGAIIDANNSIDEIDDRNNTVGFPDQQVQIAIEPFCSETTNLTAPSGTFSDGSANEDYRNRTDCKWLIAPVGATSISLSFPTYNTETNYDYVRVYDGNSTSATLLAEHDGSGAKAAVVSTGGAMLVHFTTDGSVTRTGWEASYTSQSGSNDIVNLVSPQTNEILDNRCTSSATDLMEWYFSWEALAGASRYHLEVKRQGAASAVLDIANVNTTHFLHTWNDAHVVNGNLTNWDYRVRALVNDSWTAWSAANTFSVEPLNTDCDNECETDNLSMNDAMLVNNTHRASNRIQSNGTVGTGSRVVLQAGNEIVLTSGFQTQAGANFTATIEECGAADPEENITERLNLEAFTGEEQSAKPAFSLHPNPARARVTVQLDFAAAENATVQLVDINQRPVRQLANAQTFTVGVHELDVSTANLSPGIYYVVLHTDEEVAVQRLVIL